LAFYKMSVAPAEKIDGYLRLAHWAAYDMDEMLFKCIIIYIRH